VEYRRGETIFTEGDCGEDVLYIQAGGVKLSVLSKLGREAVVAMLGPGDFLGEGCLAGQTVRMNTATAITPSSIEHVGMARMVRQLHTQHAMSDRFIAHMLSRYVRTEEDLIDQFFDSSEKRLARVLLERHAAGAPRAMGEGRSRISQKALLAKAGMTGLLVRTFLKKFKKLGFIEYIGRGPLTINDSLLSVVLHD
jgi:CRP/FNR family transcriptional regulator, cyclic AMP receptor protein